MTSECKKRVYRTMCETDNGLRHGRYKGVTYESNKKRGSKTTNVKGTAKPSPQATKKSKSDDAIYKSMSRKMFLDDAPDYHETAMDRALDMMEEYDTEEGHRKAMSRNEKLREAYAKRRIAKRKKNVKDPHDPSVWIPAIIHSPYIKYVEHDGKSFIYRTDREQAMPVSEVYKKVKATKHKIVFMNPYELFRGTHEDKKYVLKELESRPDFKKDAIKRK